MLGSECNDMNMLIEELKKRGIACMCVINYGAFVSLHFEDAVVHVQDGKADVHALLVRCGEIRRVEIKDVPMHQLPDIMESLVFFVWGV